MSVPSVLHVEPSAYRMKRVEKRTCRTTCKCSVICSRAREAYFGTAFIETEEVGADLDSGLDVVLEDLLECYKTCGKLCILGRRLVRS
jgi:hypothetical protein